MDSSQNNRRKDIVVGNGKRQCSSEMHESRSNFGNDGICPIKVSLYPAQVTVPILLLQEFVLHNRIQRAYTNPLNKAKKKFETSKKKNNSLDSFF